MIEPIRNWWCHKVLPLVYTDALSYYEMLGKFVGKLNEVIENANTLNEKTVFSVNGITPTEGNVNVGTVKSVNGSMPDASGNINLPQVSGVTSVDGVGADSSGNVPLNAVKSVNGITPTDGNVNVGTVKSVNNNTPDGSGNVNAGTVKSVNSTSPDSDGNVVIPVGVKTVNSKNPDTAGNVDVGTVKSINSSLLPDAAGNITMTPDSINAVAKVNDSVTTNLIANKAVIRSKVADELVYMPEVAIDTASTAYITKACGGLFNWLYGTGYILELDKPEFDGLEPFWEAVMYNSSGDNMTLKFTNLPAVYDTRTGDNLGGTSQVVLTAYQAVKLKKIADVCLLILQA